MDVTSVQVGHETRVALAEYKKRNGHRNYDVAVRALLEKSEEYP